MEFFYFYFLFFSLNVFLVFIVYRVSSSSFHSSKVSSCTCVYMCVLCTIALCLFGRGFCLAKSRV